MARGWLKVSHDFRRQALPIISGLMTPTKRAIPTMKVSPFILAITVFLLAACGASTNEPAEETKVIPAEVVEDDVTPLPDPTATPESAEPTLAAIEEEPTMPDPSDTPAPTGIPDADVTYVRALLKDDGTWTFYVTVSHPDTGWEDYADGWDVLLPDGTVLLSSPDETFTRLLLHPHVGEQPFTRSQRGIVIPDSITIVSVRAHDLVDGFGGQEVTVDLSASEGPDFIIERP